MFADCCARCLCSVLRVLRESSVSVCLCLFFSFSLFLFLFFSLFLSFSLFSLYHSLILTLLFSSLLLSLFSLCFLSVGIVLPCVSACLWVRPLSAVSSLMYVSLVACSAYHCSLHVLWFVALSLFSQRVSFPTAGLCLSAVLSSILH